MEDRPNRSSRCVFPATGLLDGQTTHSKDAGTTGTAYYAVTVTNSTEHTWTNCPLRASNATRFSNREQQQPQQQVNTTAEATTQAWLTHAREVDLTLESFDIAIGDPEQVPLAPASTIEEASDANAGQVLAAPATASLPLLEHAVPLQVTIAPATAEQTEEPAASYEQDKFTTNIQPGDCEVCDISKSKKASHPPVGRSRSPTRMMLVHLDLWGKHGVPSYSGCQHIEMFTDHKSRMRWGIPLKTKDEVTDALETLIKEVADPEGICIGKIHCDGAADFKGRFLAMCRSFGIAVETSPPYVPQGNAVAERGFGTVIGAARSLMLGATHLPRQLWAEAVKAAIYIKNRTPTDVLDGKAPLEVWEDKPLGSLKHMHEWGAKKSYMVGYNTTSKTWRLWDPAEPLKITNSAEVSFREVDARDVARPMHGSDPFPEQGQVFQPGIFTGAETRDEEPEPAEPNDGPDEGPPAVFETEYALVIGGWWGTLHDFLLNIGFVESTAEPCLYILDDGDVLLLVYVDDILLTGEGENKVLSIVDQLNERFETVDLGGARFLLGMGINRDRAAGTILLEQEAYTNAVLDKFGMADARPTTSPSEAGPVSVLEDEVLSAEDTTYFRSATGSLLYLSRCTRPDITHSMMVLTRSIAKPGPRAMQKLKGVLMYLKGTISIGVRNGEDAEDGNVITAFVDSDFAGDLDKGYSTTGVVLYFAGGPVEWTSSKQTVVATSSVEAEFVALSKGCNIIKYFRHLLDTINQTQEEATVVWEDNSGALKLTRSFRITPRTKHIDVKFHHVRSLVTDGVVDVKQISTSLQKADIFTKWLNPSEFLRARGMLLGV
ncbi:unnamed protein product [Ectocarpus sp. CCAP 1310/34]|nr:unnamed protein product [Ectocarpus sp. CCAP 1310/34]